MMYTDYTGTITPPLFRGMYAHNANITYSITRPQNEPIFLTFPNFELQEAVNGTCLDFIQVNLQIHTCCLFFDRCNREAVANLGYFVVVAIHLDYRMKNNY